MLEWCGVNVTGFEVVLGLFVEPDVMLMCNETS